MIFLCGGQESQDLRTIPNTDQELLGDSTGGSALEVTVGYDQGWQALVHGDEASRPWHFDSPAMITAQPACVQVESQSTLPSYEASTLRLSLIRVHPNVSQTQPRGTGEPATIQGAQGHGKRTSTHCRVRPTCTDCNRDFLRIQELKRHLRDVHGPRRRCPFCGFTWTRPDKIKDHIIASHRSKFTAEKLEDFKALCGQNIVAFLAVLM